MLGGGHATQARPAHDPPGRVVHRGPPPDTVEGIEVGRRAPAPNALVEVAVAALEVANIVHASVIGTSAADLERIESASARAASRAPYAWRVRVEGIRWVGVGTDRVAEMRKFATEVLGLEVVGQDGDDFVEFALDDGAKFELFATSAVSDEPSPFALNPVIAGFLVDDIELARDELARTPGVELLGELYVMPDGYAWQVFRAPDGHAYELVAEARPPAEGEATN